MFLEGKRTRAIGQIIHPLLIIYQIRVPLKGEINHSTEARVKLAVTNFLEDFPLVQNRGLNPIRSFY